MFPNLNAEQARFDLSNTAVAEKLGISRVAYEGKKRTGGFKLTEIKTLCEMFSAKFEYLFAEERAA